MGRGAPRTVPCPHVASRNQRSHHQRTAPSEIDRRAVLRSGLGVGAIALGATLLGGCGSDDAGTRVARANSTHQLIAAFPQSVPHIPAGVPARLPYLVSDPEGVPLTKIDSDVTFTISQGGKKIGSVTVPPRGDGVPRAYLPLQYTFPTAGIYDLNAAYDGASMDSTIEVVDPSRVGPPVVGQQLPAVDSPTTSDPLGVDPLCSRVPPCPYHEVNLNAAVGGGKPIVMLIATPAYCQTAVCGPVLDLVMEQTAGRTDLNVLHQEVYKDPKGQSNLAKAPLAPVPAAYNLAFEPVLYITDHTGLIVARADVTVDRGELTELLALAV